MGHQQPNVEFTQQSESELRARCILLLLALSSKGSTEAKNLAAQQGFEHLAKSTGKTGHYQTGDAQSDAFLVDSGPIDADLASVIDAWPTLARSVRQSIVKLVTGAEQ